jgi:hypothetical protein
MTVKGSARCALHHACLSERASPGTAFYGDTSPTRNSLHLELAAVCPTFSTFQLYITYIIYNGIPGLSNIPSELEHAPKR